MRLRPVIAIPAAAAGFTLIELMLAVTIIGVLASILTPKLGSLIARAEDARTLGNLGTLRAALASYHCDHDGKYPSFPAPYSQPAGYSNLLEVALVEGKYIDAIPYATPSGFHHRPSNKVDCVWNLSGDEDDEGGGYGHGWKFDANPYDDLKPAGWTGTWGTIMVLCTHENSKGINWKTYK